MALLPNTKIDENGINIDNLTDIINNLIASEQAIYGTDTNYDSNSPDGQRINIYALNVRDVLEKLVDVYNSFNPDIASGIALDRLVAINNIQRNSGTYTIVPIDITVDRACNLIGIDANFTDLYDASATGYTIKDITGNTFILMYSQTFTSAGTHTCNFRATNIGQVLTTLNTINIPVDIILGVISVNNSQSTIQIGTDEETDTQLRYRRSISTSINSQSYLDTLQSKLLNLKNVIDVKVYDNPTNSIVNGINPHELWCIVDGGNNTEIVDIIYKNRYGGDTKGSIETNILQINNMYMTIRYDTPVTENLYIKFNITDIFGATIDTNYLKNQIYSNFVYKIGEIANSTDISYFVKKLLSNSNISYCQVSKNGINYFDTLTNTGLQYKFVLDKTRIIING